MSDLIYSAQYGHYGPNPNMIPGQGPRWPEGHLQPQPPPQAPQPQYTQNFPLIPRHTGPASLA